MNIYYLGSSLQGNNLQGNNLSRPISILHYIPGTEGGTIVANFATVDKGLIFGAEYGSIKESIAYMNKMQESGWITQEEYEESLRQEWIPMVQTFIVSWGKTMVINDLRVALNDTEEALQMPRTRWPPFMMMPAVDITPPAP